MEKEGYRDNYELISTMYPGRATLDVKEVADILGTNLNTVYEAVHRKSNPMPTKIIGRRKILIPVAGLAKWLAWRM